MEYNTTRDKLMIREYGRNIQKMVSYVISIEDREKRTKAANIIVNIMAQMNPQVRESGDYKHKLWDHLHIISDFKLDVDCPFPPPDQEIMASDPQLIRYSDKDFKYRHYGRNIELIIQKAMEYEEGEEKQALIENIANHLKKSYLNWNRDSVNDDMILNQLEILSDGNLKLNENVTLTQTGDILARNKKKKFTKKGPKDSNGKRGDRK